MPMLTDAEYQVRVDRSLQDHQWRLLMDRTFVIDGRALRSLMRRHKVTIKEAAKRIGVAMKRVRVRREIGLVGTTACDWYEAITGDRTPRMKAAYRARVSQGQIVL